MWTNTSINIFLSQLILLEDKMIPMLTAHEEVVTWQMEVGCTVQVVDIVSTFSQEWRIPFSDTKCFILLENHIKCTIFSIKNIIPLSVA